MPAPERGPNLQLKPRADAGNWLNVTFQEAASRLRKGSCVTFGSRAPCCQFPSRAHHGSLYVPTQRLVYGMPKPLSHTLPMGVLIAGAVPCRNEGVHPCPLELSAAS
jgi:hypothetical protein